MNKVIAFNRRFSLSQLSDGSIDDKRVFDTDVKSKSEQLLDLIFGLDIHGLPLGDLAMFYNKNANPEVRRFIEDNLFIEHNPASSSPLSLPQDVMNRYRESITDDDIARFSRDGNESREEYASRLRNYFIEQRFENWKKKEQKRISEKLGLSN